MHVELSVRNGYSPFPESAENPFEQIELYGPKIPRFGPDPQRKIERIGAVFRQAEKYAGRGAILASDRTTFPTASFTSSTSSPYDTGRTISRRRRDMRL